MIKLYVKRGSEWEGNIKFYQYDREQNMLLTGIPLDEVNKYIIEIANSKCSYSAVVSPIAGEDGLEFVIPDTYLTYDSPVFIFVCEIDENGKHIKTIDSFRIPVIKRKIFE